MALSRRSFLIGGGAVAAAGLLGGCGQVVAVGEAFGGPRPPAAWPAAAGPTWRALSRLTFGPRPDELERAQAIGVNAWVEEQLAPEQLDDTAAELRVGRLDTLQMDISVIFDVREEYLRGELQAGALLRAVYSRRQLYELLVDFWSDHFSISILKEGVAHLKPIDDREVIRPHALGRFDELLWASINSPAMLTYLDNQENHAGKPNENYARELLELHSLGVAAGYTQHDVQELARCLTGWTVDDSFQRGSRAFAADRHDDGPKALLGHTLPAGLGEGDVERAHAIIVAHPALPGFIAGKLVRRFAGEAAPPALVERAAQAFRETRGEIKAVLRSILLDPEFAASAPRFKRPLRYVAGAMRQLGAATDGGPTVRQALEAMGQPLFQWPTPDGFPDRDAAWRDTLLPRWQLAAGLAHDQLDGTRIDLPGLLAASGAATMETWLSRLGLLLLGAPPSAVATTSLLHTLGPDLTEANARTALAALLAAPAYMYA